MARGYRGRGRRQDAAAEQAGAVQLVSYEAAGGIRADQGGEGHLRAEGAQRPGDVQADPGGFEP
jgi:hypothetical protein